MPPVESSLGLRHRGCALESTFHDRKGSRLFMCHQSLIGIWALTFQARLLLSVEHNCLDEIKCESLAAKGNVG